MKHRAGMTVLVSAIASASIWALSPFLIGLREPWDTASNFYVAALFVAGLVAGTISPKPLWAHYVGVLIGQIGYELTILHVGPLFLLGVVFLLAYGLVYLVAAALAGYVRSKIVGIPARTDLK
jgi:hypothetical protein